MLLTTHFLDESEVLSDHVAILSKGTLRAEGTVATLKNSLGGGYRIVLPGDEAGRLNDADIPASIIRQEDYNNAVFEAPDAAALTAFIKSLTRNNISQYSGQKGVTRPLSWIQVISFFLPWREDKST